MLRARCNVDVRGVVKVRKRKNEVEGVRRDMPAVSTRRCRNGGKAASEAER